MKTGIGLLLMSGKVIRKLLVAPLFRREQPIFPGLESKRCGVSRIFYII